MFKKPIPNFFTVLIIAIAVLHILATVFFWYWRIHWLDMAMHFSGGFWVGGMTLWFLCFGKHAHGGADLGSAKNHARLFFYAVFATLTIGILWEIFEFGSDMFAGREDYDMLDTLSDLAFDVFGAFFSAAYFIKAGYDKLSSESGDIQWQKN